MAQRLSLAALLLVTLLVGCGDKDSASGGAGSSQSITHDLTTPEGAILCLEDAYRDRDLEAAVRCKDFNIEAKLMLQRLETDFSDDEEILAKTAEVLELGFRAEMTNTGFPDFRGIQSTFSNKKPYADNDDIVQITEHCSHSDGTATTNTLVVANTADGWKVVAVPE